MFCERLGRQEVAHAALDPLQQFRRGLEAALESLRLRVRHRGRWYGLQVTHDRFVLEIEPGPPGPVHVRVFDKEPRLEPGDRYECELPGTPPDWSDIPGAE